MGGLGGGGGGGGGGGSGGKRGGGQAASSTPGLPESALSRPLCPVGRVSIGPGCCITSLLLNLALLATQQLSHLLTEAAG